MPTPDPEGFSLLAKVITAGGVVATPIVWLWTKLDKKADKHAVANQFQVVTNELAVQRSHIGKIFDEWFEGRQVRRARAGLLVARRSGAHLCGRRWADPCRLR
jgi:hypothetical protein